MKRKVFDAGAGELPVGALTEASLSAIPRIVIAATHSGTGKTTITSGLLYALRERGHTVQAFKVGPDYIDPGFHTLASGRACRNLDTLMMTESGVRVSFVRAAVGAEVCVIEGVMGLYDGLSGEEETASTAEVAKLLDAPVLLVIDISAMAGSAGAVALGFVNYDPAVRIAGFILNNAAGESHFDMARKSVEKVTGLPVLGWMGKVADLCLPERHLGLARAHGNPGFPRQIAEAARLMEDRFNLDAILAAAREAAAPAISDPGKTVVRGKNYAVRDNSFPEPGKNVEIQKQVPVRIGYALDDAFYFYYEDNLDILKSFGAELVPFSPLKDETLPRGLKGVYFGGGYPELFAAGLSGNSGMRRSIREAAEKGMPIYGECGGLMYLVERLVDFEGVSFDMVGLFPGTVRMTKKLAALGYYRGRALSDSVIAEKGWQIWGHVFHWSEYDAPGKARRARDTPGSEALRSAYSLEAPGKADTLDGLVKWNAVAGYFHMHFAGNPEFAKRFVGKCSTYGELRNLPVF